MKNSKFRFPNAIMAVAGATAMVFSTGFISSEPIEVTEETFVELELEATLGNQYRDNTCGEPIGTCMPTYCCVTTD
ncbi:hypothetical protein Belba_1798 [Belliella baltica DSM 15883]|uniref:Uncharacterized protein n=1 Tax=Belliella baltica (strain DSM 15883 / CIP 108006 / LMG 21964 / BA134) TaxID=866536 RepID=I3Z577_BELBD|nr:hypothetical protein [Belliella baltica]AFL84395.1 hypothetical protein Belba_1798 [Belliella baltica DSM 15883]